MWFLSIFEEKFYFTTNFGAVIGWKDRIFSLMTDLWNLWSCDFDEFFHNKTGFSVLKWFSILSFSINRLFSLSWPTFFLEFGHKRGEFIIWTMHILPKTLFRSDFDTLTFWHFGHYYILGSIFEYLSWWFW